MFVDTSRHAHWHYPSLPESTEKFAFSSSNQAEMLLLDSKSPCNVCTTCTEFLLAQARPTMPCISTSNINTCTCTCLLQFYCLHSSIHWNAIILLLRRHVHSSPPLLCIRPYTFFVTREITMLQRRGRARQNSQRRAELSGESVVVSLILVSDKDRILGVTARTVLLAAGHQVGSD